MHSEQIGRFESKGYYSELKRSEECVMNDFKRKFVLMNSMKNFCVRGRRCGRRLCDMFSGFMIFVKKSAAFFKRLSFIGVKSSHLQSMPHIIR